MRKFKNKRLIVWVFILVPMTLFAKNRFSDLEHSPVSKQEVIEFISEQIVGMCLEKTTSMSSIVLFNNCMEFAGENKLQSSTEIYKKIERMCLEKAIKPTSLHLFDTCIELAKINKSKCGASIGNGMPTLINSGNDFKKYGLMLMVCYVPLNK